MILTRFRDENMKIYGKSAYLGFLKLQQICSKPYKRAGKQNLEQICCDENPRKSGFSLMKSMTYTNFSW